MPTKKKRKRQTEMSDGQSRSRPGKKHIAAPVEEELYDAVAELGKRLRLNTTQLIRRAMAELIERNAGNVPEVTKRELAKDTEYKRGRPRKDGTAGTDDLQAEESATTPARPIPSVGDKPDGLEEG